MKIFLLAFALRLGFSAYFLWQDMDVLFRGDLYYALAQQWLGWGHGVGMDATHPPLYTAWIAGILWIWGRPNPIPVVALQVLLSSVVCVLVLRLARRFVPERAARLAAIWVAVDPCLIFYTPHLQTETLFVFMEMCFFLWLYRALSGHALLAEWFGLGALGGCASLCRSVFAAYPAVLLPVLCLRADRSRRNGCGEAAVPGRGWAPWAAIVLLSAGWLAPIGMWAVRNWIRYHALIPISAQMGWTLYEGFSLDREEVRRRPYEMEAEAKREGLSSPMETSRYFQEKTFRFIQQNPLTAVKIIVGKGLLYWRPWPYDPYTPMQRVILAVYFVLLFTCAALGAWITRKSWVEWLPVYALFIYLTGMHAVFFTSLRYRLALEPFLCLWGAAGLLAVRDSWRLRAGAGR